MTSEKLRLGKIAQEVYRNKFLLGCIVLNEGELYFTPRALESLKKSDFIAINKMLKAYREELEAEARRDK